jgi:hypothetical protein
MARRRDKVALIRSLHHKMGATYESNSWCMMTGHDFNSDCRKPYEIGHTRLGLRHARTVAYLGNAHEPFFLGTAPARSEVKGSDPQPMLIVRRAVLRQRLLRFVGLMVVALAGFVCACGSRAGAESPPPITKSGAFGSGRWWSLRPLVRPSVPQTGRTPEHFRPANPIDHFVLNKLLELGLEPSSEADRRTLIRRVHFDLLGLPPTPEEVDEFVADPREDAYERLVDRLLASPHLGERWARHWMDVVHFAESHGHDQDRPRPTAWPYRDYLIRSFNEDKPYSQFVAEQVAGDVLFPQNPQAIVATGFLAAGPFDESSLQSIQDDTDDRRIAQYLDRDDIVTTVMSTFVSTTVHCARCHDHFFDPITQSDYYALQAVFAGVDKGERTYDADPSIARRRHELRSELARLRGLKGPTDPSLLTAAAQERAAAWEARYVARPSLWQTLEPIAMHSAEGSTLTKQPDHSILASGKRPEKETYTLTFRTSLRGITAIRLEVLADDSLSKRGPGRQDNGNLHLNEIKVFATPLQAHGERQLSGRSQPDDAGNKGLTPPVRQDMKPLTLKNPRADFNQDGWTIAHAIDGNPGTAWGIYPRVGEDHRAVFELAQPLDAEHGAELTVVLEQTHGGGHLIGRPRISVTTSTASPALDETLIPAEIAAILQVESTQRSDQERAELARFVWLSEVERALAALPAPQRVFAATGELQTDGLSIPTKRPVRMVHLLTRGDIKQAQEVAQPGALSCLDGLAERFELSNPDDEAERRAALARWLTDRRNVLTWRSIANRIWHHHFGRGICDTPNDLGQMGGTPTNPELLDWLASELAEGQELRDKGQQPPAVDLSLSPLSPQPSANWSLKHLHRLIVTSATYRQSSQHHERNGAIDADNRYLWRMNRTRLDAESVRDAFLVATGKLDRRLGGESVKQFIQTPGIHVTPNVDYRNFDPDSPENFRRSVYRFLFRTLPDPWMETLDFADSSQLTAVRNSSVTALQALSMLNNPFTVRQSEHLAARASQTQDKLEDQVSSAVRLVLQRDATDHERTVLTDYARRHGLPNACRVLFNSNEFLFVD